MLQKRDIDSQLEFVMIGFYIMVFTLTSRGRLQMIKHNLVGFMFLYRIIAMKRASPIFDNISILSLNQKRVPTCWKQYFVIRSCTCGLKQPKNHSFISPQNISPLWNTSVLFLTCSLINFNCLDKCNFYH